jgi:branched-chain amino acid aminotransferase
LRIGCSTSGEGDEDSDIRKVITTITVGMAFLFYFGHMNYISLNGKVLPGDQPALLVSNRGYRYGDGLFEAMKVVNERIQLEQYHFERLFSGLFLLRFEIPKFFTTANLTGEILELCKKNGCGDGARVRLSVSRGHGGLYDEDNTLQYVIECWPLDGAVNKLNDNGLMIDIFPDARKSCDIFSNLKSANFLPYTMAALYAKKNKLNDCLVLNTSGNIADSTIANVFIIKDGNISTPALGEGCINGVMRRYLMEKLRSTDYAFREEAIAVSTLEMADEIFLTNAINGIRWVKQYGDKVYTNEKTVEIFNRFVQTIDP